MNFRLYSLKSFLYVTLNSVTGQSFFFVICLMTSREAQSYAEVTDKVLVM